MLSRIEIEFLHHGGKDNGKLPVTYEQFVEYGMDRAGIAPAIRETEALGFIEVSPMALVQTAGSGPAMMSAELPEGWAWAS